MCMCMCVSMCTRRGVFAFEIREICVCTVLLICPVRYIYIRVRMFGTSKYVLNLLFCVVRYRAACWNSSFPAQVASFFFWRLKKPIVKSIVACGVMCKVDTFFTILQPTFQHPAVMCNTNVIGVCVVMCKVDPFSHYYTFYDTAAGLSAFTCFYSACSENTLVSGGVGSLLYGCRPFKIHMSLMHVRAQA